MHNPKLGRCVTYACSEHCLNISLGRFDLVWSCCGATGEDRRKGVCGKLSPVVGEKEKREFEISAVFVE